MGNVFYFFGFIYIFHLLRLIVDYCKDIFSEYEPADISGVSECVDILKKTDWYDATLAIAVRLIFFTWTLVGYFYGLPEKYLFLLSAIISVSLVLFFFSVGVVNVLKINSGRQPKSFNPMKAYLFTYILDLIIISGILIHHFLLT